MEFTKMHGLGNDFILVDEQVLKALYAENQWASLAVNLCDRNRGIGADGLVVVGQKDGVDATMRIFNSDGSEAEMCGNAIRCLARHLVAGNAAAGPKLSIATGAGVMHPEVLPLDMEGTKVRVDMGEPKLAPADIPVRMDGARVVNSTLQVGSRTVQATCLSMGNPHCVVYCSNLNEVPLAEWGPALENHFLFPRRTNVEFVQVVAPDKVKVRVWERGAGATLACGTGACAVGVAGVLTGKTERALTVSLPGGDLAINWSDEDNHVYMTGPATEVFRGILTL